jgi:5-methylcytosine-specific restriction endonuclease McrA
MSNTFIPAELRRVVQARSQGLSEYCLIDENDTCLGCQIDHIISDKYGGPTSEDNLAVACVFCNQSKGSDVGSIILETYKFVRRSEGCTKVTQDWVSFETM